MSFPLFKQDGWVSPTSINYLSLGLGFLVFEQTLEIYLHLRQRKYLKKDSLPKDLIKQVESVDKAILNGNKEKSNNETPQAQEDMSRESVDGNEKNKPKEKTLLGKLYEKFTKSQSYNLDKNDFAFIRMGYDMILSVGMLLSGFNVYMWVQSKNIATNYFGYDASNEIVIGSIFLVISSFIGVFTSLPTSLYSTFVIEAKHGFNKMTPWLYFTDSVKGFLINMVITIPLMAAVVKLVRWGGSNFWIYVWALMFVFSIIMLTIYPNYIMPMFNKYSPLPEGPLKKGIENLAAQLEFPLTKLYEVDGSKRSSHSNAYLYGFFKDKRIVLYDTLIKNEEEPALECSIKEIVGILAHELGHWKLSHTLKGFVFQNIIYLLGFKAFGYFLYDSDMYNSFGFNDTEMPVLIGLSLFGQIMTPIGAVLGLALNTMTRLFEFQADAFAVALGKTTELKSGLVKISISNLASFEVDPLFMNFYHSHPCLIERLRAMDEMDTILKKDN